MLDRDDERRALIESARERLEAAGAATGEERARLLEHLYDALEDELDDAQAPPPRR
jgi:hypothetical protein